MLENLINECNYFIDDLTNECLKLNQEIQEMCDNSNVQKNDNMNDNIMFNPYPTPIEAPLDIDENVLNSLSFSFYNELPGNNQSLKTVSLDSSTFDPISISNGISKDNNVGSEMINEEILTLFMENAPLGNVCNDIDFDDMNQNLLSMQKNLVNSSIGMERSIESIIEEIKNNNVSLLESTYTDNYGNINTSFPNTMENIVSKTNLHTLLHNKGPI